MIDFDHYEGATGEVSDRLHPSSPENSRVKNDLFVHFIENTKTQQDAVRFWFPDEPFGTVCNVDYVILQKDSVDDEAAMLLIMNVFFYRMMDDKYAKKISTFSFMNLETERVYEVPYH